MKKKILIAVIVIILLVLLVPIPMRLRDGGTIEYKALIYTISKVHRLNHNSKSGYDNGLIIKIFGNLIRGIISIWNREIKPLNEIKMECSKFQIMAKIVAIADLVRNLNIFFEEL